MTGKRPRIHWISPLPPKETDIAHYTQRILPELCERADVTLWTDAVTWDDELERYCPVKRLDPKRITAGQMRSAHSHEDHPGIPFIHIGNSWVFHTGLLDLARRMPSIVVLHDMALQEMYLDAIHNQLFSRETYLEAMHRWYGEDGRKSAQQVLEGQLSAVQLGQKLPGFELAIEGAAAVLTHTPEASQAVSARGHVPGYQLELPFRATGTARADRPSAGPLRLMQFGFIGPNRRLEQVLEALAGMGPDFDFVFDIVGKVWKPGLIEERCMTLGLSEKVRQHGFVPEADLDARLARAHLVFNLRHPTMGEASGSQLRIWNAAAASVVIDQGWYRHLPNDTVFHISVEDEIPALQRLLARLATDRSIGRDMGCAGYRRLMDRHSPAQYASDILEVAGAFENDVRDALFAASARRLLARSPSCANLKRDQLARLF
jgi:glycosyltransferase involved in cell wall biosynthesis